MRCVFDQWYCICVLYLAGGIVFALCFWTVVLYLHCDIGAAGTFELTWYQPCAGLETAFGQIFIQLYFQEEILAKYLLQISS